MQKITICLQDSLKTWLVIVVCLIFCWTLPSANWLERKQLLSMPCEFERMCNKTDVYSCSKSKCVCHYFADAEDWVQFCAQQMHLQMLLAGKSIGLHFLMASYLPHQHGSHNNCTRRRLPVVVFRHHGSTLVLFVFTFRANFRRTARISH